MMIMKRAMTAGLIVIVAVAAAAAGWFVRELAAPRPAGAAMVTFSVDAGEGLRTIAEGLSAAGLIRSPFAFEAFAAVDGRARALKPGLYRLNQSMDTPQIVGALTDGNAGKATVTIPPDATVFAVDRILSNALVIRPGALIALMGTMDPEGRLFPDTYQFYTNSSPESVVREMEDNFNAKAGPILSAASGNATDTLIVASILEKEVPDQADQEIVAGIIAKRLRAGMPLDIDATICYAKFLVNPTSTASSCTLTALDFTLKSPYNTYLYKGLPPAPIGSPDLSAIIAAAHPKSSPYLYYLTDPATGKTIFAKTLDEQNQNRVKYLESNP